MYNTTLDKCELSDRLTVTFFYYDNLFLSDVDSDKKELELIAASESLAFAVSKKATEFVADGKTCLVSTNRLSMIHNIKKVLSPVLSPDSDYCVLTGSVPADKRKDFYKKHLVISSYQVILGMLTGSRKFFDSTIVPYPINNTEYLYYLLSRTKQDLVFFLPENSLSTKKFVRTFSKRLAAFGWNVKIEIKRGKI